MLPLIIILDKIISVMRRSDDDVAGSPSGIVAITGIPTFFKRKRHYIKNGMGEQQV
jgi:hypothetical protein